jgi:hypothetical protein
MSIGIRGFSIGYDFYAPERSVCFHHYATEEKDDPRAKVKHFWENGDRYAGYVLLCQFRVLRMRIRPVRLTPVFLFY